MCASSLAATAAAPRSFSVGHALEIRVQLVERGEVREQRRGGLLADAGHPGDVVDRIARERQEIRDQFRNRAEARADLVILVAHVAAVVPVHIAVADQLRQILVARHQHVAQAGGARPRRQRADDVVGLVFGAGEFGETHVPAKLAAQRELALEIRGRRLAIRLVRRVDGAADRGLAAQALVEGDADALAAAPAP